MRAIIVGAGMGGLFTALSLREAGVFTSIDVYEQTHTPSTAGAGLNIAPNGARLCQWLGIDLDGGDPKGPHGAVGSSRHSTNATTRSLIMNNALVTTILGYTRSTPAKLATNCRQENLDHGIFVHVRQRWKRANKSRQIYGCRLYH